MKGSGILHKDSDFQLVKRRELRLLHEMHNKFNACAGISQTGQEYPGALIFTNVKLER